MKKVSTEDKQKQLRKEYIREQYNLRRRIARFEKRTGLTIQIDTFYRPDKITRQSIEALKNLRAETLYEYTIEDDDQLTGSDLNLQIIADIREMIRNFDTSYFRNPNGKHALKKEVIDGILSDKFEDTISADGLYETAKRLELSASTFRDLTNHLLYGSESDIKEDANLGLWLELLYGHKLSAPETMEVEAIRDQLNYTAMTGM